MLKPINRKNKNRVGIVIGASIMLLSLSAQAVSVGDFLSNIYTDKKTLTNVTKPMAYQGQQAGYYSGGSLVSRSPTTQVSPMHITLPKIKSGCGGIDIYTGGLSFIKAPEMVELGKSIINGSRGYAVQLALESMSPMLASVKNHLEQIVNDVNRFNINSCEMSKMLVGGVASKIQSIQQHACAQAINAQGTDSDYTGAKHQCKDDGILKSGLENAPREVQVEAHFKTNIVWEALVKNGIANNNRDLAEWIMAVSGTKIFKNDGNDQKPEFLPSLMLKNTESSLLALMNGDEIEVYVCTDTTLCLSPHKTNKKVNTGLTKKVKELMDSMTDSIRNKKKLSDESDHLLDNISLPVYHMVDINSMTNKTHGYINLNSYAEIIALDWITVQLDNLLHDLSQAIYQTSLPAGDLISIDKNIQRAIHAIHHVKSEAIKKNQELPQLYRLMHDIETKRKSEVAAMLVAQFKKEGE